MRSATLAMALALTAAGAIGSARGDDGGDDSGDGDREEDAARALAKAKKAKKEAKAEAGQTVEVHGRVFARMTASREETVLGTTPWTSSLDLASARIGIDYQWRKRVRAKVSMEARGSVRDAFVEVPLGDGLRLRAGRMRLPIGALEQTSAWTLPTIERGLVAAVLSDGVGLTGRRDGVELRWRGDGAWRPTVTLAAAQGVNVLGDDLVGPVEDGGAITVAARVAVEPCPMYRVALVGASRAYNAGTDVARYWSATLEAEVDLEAIGRGFRLWGDATYGTAHFGDATVGDPDRGFLAGELAAGYRLGGDDGGAPYVEPFVGAGWLNPITDRARDDVAEVVVGVAGGRWKRWRVQAQVAYQNAKALRPAGLLGTTDVNDKLTATTQLGAAF